MEKVKSKLATWKWARENDANNNDEGATLPLPLLSVDHHRGFSQTSSHPPSHPHSPRHEMPLTPPNTEKNSTQTSAKPSAPHTRLPSEEHAFSMDSVVVEQDEDGDDEEDQPLELRVRATFSRPSSKRHTSDPTSSTPHDYLSISNSQRSGHRSPSTPPSPCGGTRNAKKHTKAISRQLSNLAAEDSHFKTHRDSVELMRHRELSGESLGRESMNQELMGTRDSFVLSRARVGKVREKDRQRDLSPIVDASPPDQILVLPLAGEKRAKEGDGMAVSGIQSGQGAAGGDQGGKGGRPLVGGDEKSHPDEHVDCPIYEVERPRWFQARFGGKRLGS